LVVDYSTPEQFIEAVDLEVSNGGLLVRGAKVESGSRSCSILIRLNGEVVAEIEAQIEAVARTGVAVSFDDIPFELVALADRLRAGEVVVETAPPLQSDDSLLTPVEESDFLTPVEEAAPAAPPPAPAKPEAPRLTLSERIAALTVAQKMQLGLSGEREERIALLRDTNKFVHIFVLRNPRIEMDEVMFAAKNTQISPDALTYISEHVHWSKNVQLCAAVVRNVKTPMPVALRLLPKLPGNEIRAIAKGGARDQLVNAARKLLAG
jgi:hypothetical protein